MFHHGTPNTLVFSCLEALMKNSYSCFNNYITLRPRSFYCQSWNINCNFFDMQRGKPRLPRFLLLYVQGTSRLSGVISLRVVLRHSRRSPRFYFKHPIVNQLYTMKIWRYNLFDIDWLFNLKGLVISAYENIVVVLSFILRQDSVATLLNVPRFVTV